MDKVEETDRYTVTVTFKEPTGLLPEFLAEREAMMLPRDIADKAGKQRLTTEMAIGTGPYKLIEHKVDRHLRLSGSLTFLASAVCLFRVSHGGIILWCRASCRSSLPAT